MMKRICAVLLCTGLLSEPASAQPVTKSDLQWSSEGRFMTYSAPWCARYDKSLIVDRDFSNSISYKKGDLANGRNVRMKWRWPRPERRSAKCGVFGYTYVGWGNYDSGAVRSPVAPSQVKSIKALSFSYDAQSSADTEQFNGLGEFFLTKNPGAADQKVIEIGWFWNAPALTRAWARTGRQLGRIVDPHGVRWSVSVNKSGAAGTYVTFIPVDKRTSGTFEGKAVLNFLRRRGVVDGDWWFNGAAIGVEPLGGAGSAVVRTFKVTLK
jgi:hypothetical protein